MDILKSDIVGIFSESGYYYQRTGGRKLANYLHSHTFYEFIYIISGACVHELDYREETLIPGDLVFIKPGQTHRFISQSDKTDVVALSVITNEVDEFFELYKSYNFSDLPGAIKLAPEKIRILNNMCENVIFTETEKYKMYLKMILNQIFLFCIQAVYFENTNIPAKFAEILDKMQNADLSDFGIDTFLKVSGYSHSQLCRLTKRYLGITPIEFINRIRMNHAYKLIVNTNLDYETICNTVGFESLSYFSKLVKKNFGCSAVKLRNASNTIDKTV